MEEGRGGEGRGGEAGGQRSDVELLTSATVFSKIAEKLYKDGAKVSLWSRVVESVANTQSPHEVTK